MIARAIFVSGSEPLSADKAWRILQPYWEQVAAHFRRQGHPQVSKVRVEVDERWHDSCRHYAAMTEDCSLVGFAPQMADLPDEQVLALMAHEAGHVVDFSNPGRYWYRPAAAVRVRSGCKISSVQDVDPREKGDVLFYYERLPESMGKHMRDWKNRGKDETEGCADAIAEAVTGKPIRYTGPKDCLVETFGTGIKRPRGLR